MKPRRHVVPTTQAADFRELLTAYDELADSDAMSCMMEDPWVEKAVQRLRDAVVASALREWAHLDGVGSGFDHLRAAANLQHPQARGQWAGERDGYAWATDGVAFFRWRGDPCEPTEKQVPTDVMWRHIEGAGPPEPVRRVTGVDGERLLMCGSARVDARIVERWTNGEPETASNNGEAGPVVIRGDDWDLVVMPCLVEVAREGWAEEAAS